MPATPTPRLGIPLPAESDPADVPLDLSRLAYRLDTIAGRVQGVALTQAPVLDVGVAGQVRAGRQLSTADFAVLGLSAPLGLWNLSSLADASGFGRALTNKGAVPFGVGINGLVSTAAVFAGSSAQALFIADTGAGDPFRIRTGSWGCWARTAKRGTSQYLLTKAGATGAAGYTFWLNINDTNSAYVNWSTTGNSSDVALSGIGDIADDRWHFVVVTADGSRLALYVDSALEAATTAGPSGAGGGPLNIGGWAADAANANLGPHYGRVDEAFVTADVLSDDQVRALYCASIPHGYPVTPTGVTLKVRRRKRGGALAAADFPTRPLRLHNFTAGSLGDEGSGNVTLVNAGAALPQIAGADGSSGNALSFGPTATAHLAATDIGLPSGSNARSYGCWFKGQPSSETLVSWGTFITADTRLRVPNGVLTVNNGGDAMSGPFVLDGQWHLAIVVEDNAAGDGVRRKLYLDGRLVGGSTVLNPITLGGANHFGVGAAPDGTLPFAGQLDGVFVCDYALTFEQIAALYAKGSQALAPSPKEPGAHVESMDATNVYATFDTLRTTAQVDLEVME